MTVITLTLSLLVFLMQGRINALQQPRAWMVPQGIKFGDLRRLKLKPQPESDSTNSDLVRVATRAVGLNFADVFSVLGYYKAANQIRGSTLEGFCPGLEFSGIVLQDDSGKFRPGDKVFGFTRFGAYADVVTTRAEYLRLLPLDWTFEQGASFVVNVLTAWHGLVTVCGMPINPNYNKVVLVHSSAGGVGIWASEIAAQRGGVVVGVVGSEQKRQAWLQRMMSKCPAAQCIVRDRYTFSDDLQQAVVEARRRALGEEPQFDARSLEEVVKYGWGIDYVMESYGGPYFEPSLNLINAGGNMATYGSTSYNREGGFRLPLWSIVWQYLTRPRIDPGELTTRNIRVGGFNLIFLTERIEELNAALDQCLLLNCVPLVGIAFDFDTQAVDALEALRSGQSIGKVVLSNTNNPMLPAR